MIPTPRRAISFFAAFAAMSAALFAPSFMSDAAAQGAKPDAAHRLASGFALENEKDQRAKKRAAARRAGQLAAEKTAMEAARREALAAKDNAELQAYRKDLMRRARQEADRHRKAAAAAVEAQSRKQASSTQADSKHPNSKVQNPKLRFVNKNGAAITTPASKRAANSKSIKSAQKPNQNFKIINANAGDKGQPGLRAARSRSKKRSFVTINIDEVVLPQRSAFKRRRNHNTDVAIAAPRIKNTKLEDLALAAESARLSKLERTRNAELNDLDAQLARKARQRRARLARQAEQAQQAAQRTAKNDQRRARREAETARLAQADRLEKSDRLASVTRQEKLERVARQDQQLEAQRLSRRKNVMVERAARQADVRLADAESDTRRASGRLANRDASSRSRRVEVLSGRTKVLNRGADAAWEREEAARLTREAARRFSGRLARQQRGEDFDNTRAARRSNRRVTQRFDAPEDDYAANGADRDRDRDRRARAGRRAIISRVEGPARIRGLENRADRLGADHRNGNAIGVDVAVATDADTDASAGAGAAVGRGWENSARRARRSERTTGFDHTSRFGRRDADRFDEKRFANGSLVRRRHKNTELARRYPVTRYAPGNQATAPSARLAPALPTYSRPANVTVLLVMKPGRRGIRRFNKTGDPVLCTKSGCYISNGSNRAASFVSKRRALGPKNTFGRRAGACKRQLTCVFRNVAFGPGSLSLQPVDLRVLRHDRRARKMVDAPSRCEIAQGRLSCSNAFASTDYVMWVVPEDVAARAGAAALQRAVARGLPRAPVSRAGYSGEKFGTPTAY